MSAANPTFRRLRRIDTNASARRPPVCGPCVFSRAAGYGHQVGFAALTTTLQIANGLIFLWEGREARHPSSYPTRLQTNRTLTDEYPFFLARYTRCRPSMIR